VTRSDPLDALRRKTRQWFPDSQTGSDLIHDTVIATKCPRSLKQFRV
jgi:hypothetical protein